MSFPSSFYWKVLPKKYRSPKSTVETRKGIVEEFGDGFSSDEDMNGTLIANTKDKDFELPSKAELEDFITENKVSGLVEKAIRKVHGEAKSLSESLNELTVHANDADRTTLANSFKKAKKQLKSKMGFAEATSTSISKNRPSRNGK